MTSSTNKKRKLTDENRCFNPEWNKLFFMLHKDTAQCVICQKTVGVMKDYNMRRHFESVHPEYAKIDAAKKKQEFTRLSSALQRQTALFVKSITAAQTTAASNTTASYRVAYLVATRLKPFTDGKLVKDCVLAIADEVCPEKKAAFEKVSLSAPTLTRRVQDMRDDVLGTLKQRFRDCRYFAIALDESTDVKDTAQLAIYFRGVTDSFDIIEEFAQLVPMIGTTTGADVLAAVLSWIKDFELNLSRLCGVTTDGAPAMVGKHKGFASLLVKHVRDLGHNQDIKTLHCIVHQEALCAKSATITEVMSVIVKAVNMVLSHALNHRQFKDLLAEADAQYGDLLYYCEVRWLSRGKMLERAYELRKELASFLEAKGFEFPQLRDPQWCQDLAFLVDLTAHMNQLNTQLQGKELLVSDMVAKVKAFQVKLMLWEKQLQARNFTHFAQLAALMPSAAATCRYACAIRHLKTEFEVRFQDLTKHSQDIALFSDPFEINPSDVPSDLQMDLIELQCDDAQKSRFMAMGPVAFWKSQAATYPSMATNARKIAALFGSTYCCEQLFSRMKLIKSSTRSQLTENHLQASLLLSVSSVKPNFKRLSAGMNKHQPSH